MSGSRFGSRRRLRRWRRRGCEGGGACGVAAIWGVAQELSEGIAEVKGL